tara:strand:+ start:128 stop:328 length:201 start_codon:yes stop_codon:yes gene_type:complete
MSGTIGPWVERNRLCAGVWKVDCLPAGLDAAIAALKSGRIPWVERTLKKDKTEPPVESDERLAHLW